MSQRSVVVVGDTSTGKSTTINFLLGYPFNFESAGVASRRPCVIQQVSDPSCPAVIYEVNFAKDKDAVVGQTFDNMEQVARKVADANDPRKNPSYFDCLEKDPNMNLWLAFDAEPIYVTMKHESFKCPLRVIDLPGFARNLGGPTEIAKKYLQPGNFAILVMGMENPANACFPELLEDMISCEQMLFVQNFAENALTCGTAEVNYAMLKQMISELAGNDTPNAKNAENFLEAFKIYMTDYGYPCTDAYLNRGIWQEGRDQGNWTEIASERGCQAVQEAMHKHAQNWAVKMQSTYKGFFEEYGCGAGIEDILAKIKEFQEKVEEQGSSCDIM